MNGSAPVVPRLAVSDLAVDVVSSAREIVSDITFQVGGGQVIGLVGESGSGKTTLGLALLGFARRGLRISKGTVLLDGRDVLALDDDELRDLRGAKVAYVAQDPASALNPMIRVKSQVREALTLHRDTVGSDAEIDQRVTELLAEVDLPATEAFLRRYPHQLSGGQQQRIAIAMAFACRPALIVLDEPTTGLDVTTQRYVLDTIAQLAERYGVAAVYISHDLAVVAQVAKTVAVMKDGRIVEQGQTAQIFTQPEHVYTKLLISAIPSLERRELLDAQPSDRRHPEAGQQPHISAPAVLTLHQLRASYGVAAVVHGVNLEVPAQTCVALVGESGSGKTTLARCVVGLHPSWQGDVIYHGETLSRSVRQRPPRVLQRIQYIFQNPYMSLNPRRTVGQLVAQPIQQFYSLSRAEVEQRVLAALDEVSLPTSFIGRYPDELSGGERQRVAIARALAAQPELLVCDEVSSALDVSVQATIIELLKTLQSERQLAMLFITHNLAVVQEIAQHVVVLEAGVVAEAGETSQILEHPQAPYTQRLLADAPRLSLTSGR